MQRDAMLQREVTAVLSQLDMLLSSSVALFHTPSSRCPLASQNASGGLTNGIRGSVEIQEDTLCSMEIMVKPTKTSSMVKSTFRDDKQWKLQQIQDAVNHLKMASNSLAPFSNTRDAAKKLSKAYIIDILENLLRSVNMCRTRLFSPCKLSLEALVTSGIVKMFTPALPGDTIMNFFILEDSLVITHYTVQQMHTPLSKNSHTLHTPKLFHAVGSILEHAGSYYEVATAHKALCHIPWLSRVLLATDICLQLGDQLKEKLVLA